MNDNLQRYVAPNAAYNASLADAKVLISRLAKLGVTVRSLVACPGSVGVATDYAAESDLVSLGATQDDKLYLMLQLWGDDRYQTVATLIGHMSTLDATAIWRVMSDLFPGPPAQSMTFNAIMGLPSVKAAVHADLS